MTEMAGSPDLIDTIILEKAYNSGDPMAVKAMNQMIHWLGVWFYNLYVCFNVNCFVIGGGLVNLGEKFLSPIRRKFDEYNRDERPVFFKIAECGEEYAILGASELVCSAMEDK
jgi:glucokinase